MQNETYKSIYFEVAVLCVIILLECLNTLFFEDINNMNKAKLHFQLSFSRGAEAVIKRVYNLADDDEVLLAVWFSDRTYSIFERRGFVVTKNGLAWNFVTMAETAAADGAKERAPRNTNFPDSGKVYNLPCHSFAGSAYHAVFNGIFCKSGEGKSRVLCTLFYYILSCDSYYAL